MTSPARPVGGAGLRVTTPQLPSTRSSSVEELVWGGDVGSMSRVLCEAKSVSEVGGRVVG